MGHCTKICIYIKGIDGLATDNLLDFGQISIRFGMHLLV